MMSVSKINKQTKKQKKAPDAAGAGNSLSLVLTLEGGVTKRRLVTSPMALSCGQAELLYRLLKH